MSTSKMSWYLDQIIVMVKLAIVKEIHNIRNIIYDIQSLQTVMNGGTEEINYQGWIYMGVTGVKYIAKF